MIGYKFIILIVLLTCKLAIAATIEDKFESIKSNPNALYAFLKKMPKGGELHYHLAGGAYPETMLAVAAKKNYCLSKDTLTMHKMADCSYIEAKDLIQHPDVYDQALRAWSMKDFVPGTTTGHDHFFAAFYKFYELVADNHVPLLAEIMQRAANQHELYLEVMLMPDMAKSTQFVKPNSTNNYDELRKQLMNEPGFNTEITNTVNFCNNLLKETKQFLGCDKNPNQAVCHLTVRFQYHVIREQPLEKIFAQALHAFETASRSQAIVGVNIVQPEDGMFTLRDYRQQMAIFNYMHQLYPQVNIALHAGELAPQDVTPEDLGFHIHDAITVGKAKRIGHGVDIAFENNAEETLNLMRNQQIAVEINLTSNEKILGIKGKQHPLNYYLQHQVPVVLSTDDEGMLRTDLTREYVKAVLEHHLNYATLKQVNRNALTYSFLPGKSIWANPAKAELIAECQSLSSQSCQDFIKTSEKAQLQYQLEQQLKEFEAEYLH